MNTYGALPNASLLHLYGFSEARNPHNVVGRGTRPASHRNISDLRSLQALIQSSTVREVYGRTCQGRSHDISYAQRWESLRREDLMEDEFEVDSSGRPEQSLLAVVKVSSIFVLWNYYLITFSSCSLWMKRSMTEWSRQFLQKSCL